MQPMAKQIENSQIDITTLMKESYNLACDAAAGKLAPAQANAAARHLTNVAKFMELRCKYGNQAI